MRVRPWAVGGLAVALIGAGGVVAYSLRSSDSANGAMSRAAFEPAASTPPAVPSQKPSPSATPSPMATAVQSAKRKTSATRSKRQPAAQRAASAGNSGAGSGRIRFGHTYHGIGTFYAATGAGNCMYDASNDLMVGAMNQQDYDDSQSCGAYLAVTGPSGRTITIKVVDRCRECPPGAIDLSKEAFTKLAPAVTGRIDISWRLLSPALSSPVSYRYKTGSSQYWCGIQVLGHRNPVRTLELKTGTSWRQIPRQDYNYFVSDSGAGCGGTIRITDIYGNRITGSGIRISPGSVQRGHAQFPAR